MIVIGLTGSIGMGKSTAAAMLSYLGAAVHDADACVHELLRHDSPAWSAFAAAFPHYLYPQIYGKKWSWRAWRCGASPWWRSVNKQALGKLVFENDALREKLEGVLHPFVRQEQTEFIAKQRRTGRIIVVLDIPLLFETGADSFVDYTLVVSAPAHVQHSRVLARPKMNEKKLKAILERQMPDGEKCARAHFVVHSGLGRSAMMRGLKGVLTDIKRREQKEEVAV